MMIDRAEAVIDALVLWDNVALLAAVMALAAGLDDVEGVHDSGDVGGSEGGHTALYGEYGLFHLIHPIIYAYLIDYMVHYYTRHHYVRSY